ncbi:hypothetical protein NDU88_004259 [Pleurodeles waltl]|uniref:Uncharacterized protein n=1 Tax=Pleurodeles waltl TaxID=8319 RepID=A0AAV7SI93_PLEWA|nr:hypothetical protein NDU88_004259 [Pleurodeles waltl]
MEPGLPSSQLQSSLQSPAQGWPNSPGSPAGRNRRNPRTSVIKGGLWPDAAADLAPKEESTALPPHSGWQGLSSAASPAARQHFQKGHADAPNSRRPRQPEARPGRIAAVSSGHTRTISATNGSHQLSSLQGDPGAEIQHLHAVPTG